MNDDLLKEQPSYQVPTQGTPYQRAQQEWDDRIGGARVQARNWRIACLLSLLLALSLATFSWVLLSQSKTKVFIAQLGKQGQVVNVAPLQQQYQPQVTQYQYIIGQFINNTMMLSLDPQIVKRAWLNSYSFVSGKAKLQLNQLAHTADFTNLVGKVTKTVKIESIQEITPNSYEAKWTQKAMDRSGKIIQNLHYSGVFTVSHRQPQTEQEILQNPLGIKILYFTLQESS